MIFKDFLGREINIGDRLVVAKYGRTSVFLIDSEVIGFTPKGIRCRKEVRYFNGNITLEEFLVYSSENTVKV